MLRAFQSLSGGDWQEISVGDLAGRQPRDQERDLIVYGPMDDPAIPTYEANMATSPSMPAAEPHSYPLVPIIGIGVLTLVALAVWNSLSRKV